MSAIDITKELAADFNSDFHGGVVLVEKGILVISSPPEKAHAY